MTNSLIAKASIAMLLCIALIFGTYGLYDYSQLSNRLNKQLEAKITLISNSLSNTLGSALWDYQLDVVENSLKSNAEIRVVKMIGVVTSDDSTYAFKMSETGEVIAITDTLELDNIADLRRFKILSPDNPEDVLGELFIEPSKASISHDLTNAIVIIIIKMTLAIVISISVIILLLNSLVKKPINAVTLALKDIAMGDGDLRVRLPSNSSIEINQLSEYFNQFVQRIQKMVIHSSNTSIELLQSVDQLRIILHNCTEFSHKQEKKADMASTSINEMSTKSVEIATNASKAADVTKLTNDKLGHAMGIISTTVSNIQKLAGDFSEGTEGITNVQSRVNDIGTMLDVVKSIAEQTNLLALNAAIEAARAGEQGRGFAVVADEVRALAGRTQESTEKIRTMMERLQESADNAVETMKEVSAMSQSTSDLSEDAFKSLRDITLFMNDLNDMNSLTASNVEYQSKESESVSNNIHQIAVLSNDVSNVSAQALKIGNKTEELANELKLMISTFKA